jgi:hypothetical protein
VRDRRRHGLIVTYRGFVFRRVRVCRPAMV